MSNMEFILLVLIMMVAVQITRGLPFVLFGNRSSLPKIIEYLGKVLPAAMMGLLVIYCIKDVDFTSFSGMMPTIVASVITVVLHVWKRNTVLSIALGTVIYMILIRIM